MKTNQVKNLSPFERLRYWITERESIRLKRLAGKPFPWTDDEILQTYRFCNVVRIEDTVSQWLLHKWYKPCKDHPNMLLACALARFINQPLALQHIGFPAYWDHNHLIHHLREFRDNRGQVFNSAYMVRGNDGIDKIECVVDYYVSPLERIKEKVYKAETMQEAWELILPSYGMGSFMAGQIVADLRWAITNTWKDKNYWAPMGPGSKRGMNRLLERDIKYPMRQEEFIHHLTYEVRGRVTHQLPSTLANRMEAIDWQNCLCEADKYERTLWGEGKPKRLFRNQ